jgi:hypothetical protein
MEARFQSLRFLRRLLWPLSWLAAIIAGDAVVNSFRKPPVNLADLYRWSEISMRVGLGAIFAGLALGFFVSWLAEPFGNVNQKAQAALKKPSWLTKFATFAGFAMALTRTAPNFRYVRPEGNRWIATGKAKPGGNLCRARQNLHVAQAADGCNVCPRNRL